MEKLLVEIQDNDGKWWVVEHEVDNLTAAILSDSRKQLLNAFDEFHNVTVRSGAELAILAKSALDKAHKVGNYTTEGQLLLKLSMAASTLSIFKATGVDFSELPSLKA
jgi:hypothetical protein